MRIGVPKEIKVHEYRVGLVPAAVRELTGSGHEVMIQSGAGAGIGCSDDDYRSAGARIAADADAIFSDSQLIVKVKEPQLAECAGCVAIRCCSPICIWPPIARRPKR